MRIGIDAKWFFDGPPSGRVVIRNLVEQFIKLNSEDEIFIYLSKSDRNKDFPFKNPNVKLYYIWAGNNLISNLLFLPKLASKLKNDIVIFQNYSSFLGNFRKIVFIHDVLFLSNPDYYTLLEKIYFRPIRVLSKKADLIITVSKSEKDRLIEYKFPLAIEVIYHGVDNTFKPCNFFKPDLLQKLISKYNLPKCFILFVGRLNVRKNIFNLLNAVPFLKNDIPMVIVGKQDWKTLNIPDLANKLKIGNKLIFTGPIYGEELAAIYSLSTIFCFPSFAESFGLPALEGMASGIPVVVSNTTSLPEICGEAGNYVDPNNPKNIANMIDTLLEDKELYERKKMLGLGRAKLFSWENSAKQLIDHCYKFKYDSSK